MNLVLSSLSVGIFALLMPSRAFPCGQILDHSTAASLRIATYNLLTKNSPVALAYPGWSERAKALRV